MLLEERTEQAAVPLKACGTAVHIKVAPVNLGSASLSIAATNLPISDN